MEPPRWEGRLVQGLVTGKVTLQVDSLKAQMERRQVRQPGDSYLLVQEEWAR